MPLSQAIPGYLITAPPSVCVPDALCTLAVWIQNHTQKKLSLNSVMRGKETKERRGENQTITQSIKQKHTIYIITLVWYLGWVFETQQKKEDRPLVIITIQIPQSTPNIQIHPLQNNIHESKIHCGSAFEPSASKLPYYCTPSVCVADALGALAVWRQNKNKTKQKMLWRWQGAGYKTVGQ